MEMNVVPAISPDVAIASARSTTQFQMRIKTREISFEVEANWVCLLPAEIDGRDLLSFMAHLAAYDEPHLMILLSLLCSECLGDRPTSSR